MLSLFAIRLLALSSLFILLPYLASAVPDVRLADQSTAANFSIHVNDQLWFQSGTTLFRANDYAHTQADGTLTIVDTTANYDGSDAVGRYKQYTVTYNDTKTNSLSVRTAYKLYYSLASQPDSDPSRSGNTRAIVFTQTYLTAVTGTNTTRQSIISAYPAFQLLPKGTTTSLGFYQWAAQFFWTNRHAGTFDAQSDIYGGVENGPLVVFDLQADTAVMMAPFDQFMDSSMAAEVRASGRELGYGSLGNMLSVPAGWSMSTILYFDDGGIVSTVSRFGDLMRAVYGKSRETSANDLVNSYLGYNTDRGSARSHINQTGYKARVPFLIVVSHTAMLLLSASVSATYYVNNAPNKTYEETIYAVHEYSQSLKLPYKYWLTDSRWYQQGKDGGVQTWTPKTEFFSEGFPIVTQRTGWQLVAHNRYWSADTPFAKQNGGQYDWVVQGNSSMPIDVRFWNDLFTNRSDWGLSMLFQDWLYTVSDGMDAINQQLGLGDQWLGAMANAAAQHDISIQYCMALSRHLFQSLKYRAVTQIRASNDGMPNDVFKQWQIGESALLAWSLGVIPFKDNFWTTSVQCVNPYCQPNHHAQPISSLASHCRSDGELTMNCVCLCCVTDGQNCTEPNLYLEGFVASMSAGAVAPGDGVGMANASLIFRSIRTDGLLLKPTRPMASIDQWYKMQASYTEGVQWQLQETYTELQGLRWHYVMAVDLLGDMEVTAAMLHIDITQQSYIAYFSDSGYTSLYHTARSFNASQPLVFPPSTLPTFSVYNVVPVLADALVLYGERDKWVRISQQRILSLDWQTDPFVLTINMLGEPGEAVVMEWADVRLPTVVHAAECVVDATGRASVTVQQSGQWSCHQQPSTAKHNSQPAGLLLVATE